MSGEDAEVYQLWLEMTGQAEKEDFEDVWAVQLGRRTEELQLWWYERKKGGYICRHQEVVVHPRHLDFSCTLDGWISDRNCPIEVKHCGGWESVDEIVARYKAQCHFQMMCTESSECVMSIILGAAEPKHPVLIRDNVYADELLARAIRFMACVRARTPPGPLPAVLAPPPSEYQDYDMGDDKEWQRYAGTWLQTYGAAEDFETAEKKIKNLVPRDARKAFGAGVICKRDRAGRLSLRSDV
jgi:hypothetical protein